jgi:hypothetical protein
MLSWPQAESFFRLNGGLLEILIRDFDDDDWQRFLEVFPKDNEYRYTKDGIEGAIPMNASLLMLEAEFHETTLYMSTMGLEWMCHFFCQSELAIEFRSSCISSLSAYETLLSLLKQLALVFNKQVLIAPEDITDMPILIYDSSADGIAYYNSNDV